MSCHRALGALLLLALVLPGCGGSEQPNDEPAAIGDVANLTLSLEDARRREQWIELAALKGTRATVLLGWSVPCPCVEAVEERVQALMRRFSTEQGVRWAAIDGEPSDTTERVREKLLRLDAPYVVLLDPDQRACRRLGLEVATQVVILDERGRVRYRGALDADLAIGQGEHIAAVLAALLEEQPVPFAEQPQPYGCAFGDPAAANRLR